MKRPLDCICLVWCCLLLAVASGERPRFGIRSNRPHPHQSTSAPLATPRPQATHPTQAPVVGIPPNAPPADVLPLPPVANHPPQTTSSPSPVAIPPASTPPPLSRTTRPTSTTDGKTPTTVLLAPTRIPVTTANRSISPPQQCDEERKRQLYKYYVSNQQLQNDCTAVSSGYTFPFAGFPSRTEMAGLATSDACLVLLQGVFRVVPRECLLGDMPVRATARTILQIATRANRAGMVKYLPNEEEIREIFKNVGEQMDSGALPESTGGNVTLSSELKIITGWQYASNRNQSSSEAGGVHGDAELSGSLPSEMAAEKKGGSNSKENFDVQVLDDTVTSASVPRHMLSLCLGGALLVVAVVVGL